MPLGGVHATRRNAARREISARVALKSRAGEVLDGWALNVSRGGVRVILEGKVELGGEFEITVAEDGASHAGPQRCRVVWVQQEPDGVVAGIEFLGSNTVKAAPSSGDKS